MFLQNFQTLANGNLESKDEKDVFIKAISEEVKENLFKDKIDPKCYTFFVGFMKSKLPYVLATFDQEDQANEFL